MGQQQCEGFNLDPYTGRCGCNICVRRWELNACGHVGFSAWDAAEPATNRGIARCRVCGTPWQERR